MKDVWYIKEDGYFSVVDLMYFQVMPNYLQYVLKFGDTNVHVGNRETAFDARIRSTLNKNLAGLLDLPYAVYFLNKYLDITEDSRGWWNYPLWRRGLEVVPNVDVRCTPQTLGFEIVLFSGSLQQSHRLNHRVAWERTSNTLLKVRILVNFQNKDDDVLKSLEMDIPCVVEISDSFVTLENLKDFLTVHNILYSTYRVNLKTFSLVLPEVKDSISFFGREDSAGMKIGGVSIKYGGLAFDVGGEDYVERGS